MAKIDGDGVIKLKNGLKTPLISIYDKLSKSGEFSKIQDEFDHMMAFIKDMETNWKNENSVLRSKIGLLREFSKTE